MYVVSPYTSQHSYKPNLYHSLSLIAWGCTHILMLTGPIDPDLATPLEAEVIICLHVIICLKLIMSPDSDSEMTITSLRVSLICPVRTYIIYILHYTVDHIMTLVMFHVAE